MTDGETGKAPPKKWARKKRIQSSRKNKRALTGDGERPPTPTIKDNDSKVATEVYQGTTSSVAQCP